jgi:hypothetical protein
MLRSTLRKHPRAAMWNMRDGFGVSLDAETYAVMSYRGRWSAEDMRDLHALLATWYVADPARLQEGSIPLAGVLRRAQAESA